MFFGWDPRLVYMYTVIAKPKSNLSWWTIGIAKTAVQWTGCPCNAKLNRGGDIQINEDQQFRTGFSRRRPEFRVRHCLLWARRTKNKWSCARSGGRGGINEREQT